MKSKYDIGRVEHCLDDEQLKLFTNWADALPEGNLMHFGFVFRFKFIIIPGSVGEEITAIDLITEKQIDLSMCERW